MRNIVTYIVYAICFVSCITNDLPYPLIEPFITSMVIEDAQQVDIDHENHIITAYFPETKDLGSVKIIDVSYDREGVSSSIPLIGSHNLNTPLKFDIRLYYDYSWKVVAIREIDRTVVVSGQIGTPVIDSENCRVFLKVGKKINPSRVDITALKLGPSGLTHYVIYDPETGNKLFEGGDEFVNALKKINMSVPLEVYVTAFGVTTKWTIYLEVSDISVEIQRVSTWTYDAYVVAIGEIGITSQFRYREAESDDWTDVGMSDIDIDGGMYTAHIKGLKAQTQYEVYAISGADETPVTEFVTSQATPLPNGSFEYASLVTGKDYYKFYDPSCGVNEGSYMFWGSGNGEGPDGINGSANMGIIITTIDTKDKVDGKQSVCAQTSEMVGILAAGNLFTGQFYGLVGTEGGMVNFGRPWSTRPKALKLHLKYKTDCINIISKLPVGVNLTNQDYDRAQIKVALGNWNYKEYGGTQDSPVHVNTTKPSTFVDFTADKSTIAYGDLILYNDGYLLNNTEKVTSSTEEWQEYTIPLNYNNIFTEPTHIIISCAASQYGDYFTGCSASKLWIDAVELIY